MGRFCIIHWNLILNKISARNAIAIVCDRYLVTSLNIILTSCGGADFHLSGHVLAECDNRIKKPLCKKKKKNSFDM